LLLKWVRHYYGIDLLDSIFYIVVILIPEKGVKAMAVYADIIVADVSEETVCCIAFNIFPRADFFELGVPLMNIMTRGA
jgi:hypothetical protein